MSEETRHKPDLNRLLAKAVQHHADGRFDEAEAAYLAILRNFPDQVAAISNLATIVAQKGQVKKALSLFDRALRIKPDFLDALKNKAIALTAKDRFEETMDVYDRIADIDPSNNSVLQNKAFVLTFLGRIEEAKSCYKALAAFREEEHEAEYSWAMLALLTGDFKGGWKAHESRLKKEKPAKRAKILAETEKIPKWEGEPLTGKTILIDAEQGLGDSIQFIRYAKFLQEKGACTVVIPQTVLFPLLSHVEGIDYLVPSDGTLPEVDFYTPFMSIPNALADTEDSIPADVPYIHVDPDLEEKWRNKLAGIKGYKIGIFWHGSPDYSLNNMRSVPLEAFRPLAEIKGVTLINLQKGPGCDEIAELDPPFELIDFGDELDEKSGAFMDSAAIIKTLDLVVSSDSAITHLAGALAAPVWILLSDPPDWRWMLEREDSPWYPTARLFRQKIRGDWAEVMERVVGEVKKRVRK